VTFSEAFGAKSGPKLPASTPAIYHGHPELGQSKETLWDMERAIYAQGICPFSNGGKWMAGSRSQSEGNE